MHIETRRATGASPVRQRTLHECDLLHVAQPFDRDPVLLDHLANPRIRCENLDRHLYLGFDFQLRPQVPHADNQILQDRHLRLGREINLFLIRLRICCQCD